MKSIAAAVARALDFVVAIVVALVVVVAVAVAVAVAVTVADSGDVVPHGDNADLSIDADLNSRLHKKQSRS